MTALTVNPYLATFKLIISHKLSILITGMGMRALKAKPYSASLPGTLNNLSFQFFILVY